MGVVSLKYTSNTWSSDRGQKTVRKMSLLELSIVSQGKLWFRSDVKNNFKNSKKKLKTDTPRHDSNLIEEIASDDDDATTNNGKLSIVKFVILLVKMTV